MTINLCDAGMTSDSFFQVTSAGGSPITLASSLSISPADIVTSFSCFLSIFGGTKILHFINISKD